MPQFSNIKALFSGAVFGATLPIIYKNIMRKFQKTSEVEYLNPPELSEPVGYSHITTASLRPNSKIIYIAGQASLDKDKKNVVIGTGDVAVQARNSYTNLGIALKAAGASPKNVLKSNIYTTTQNPDDIEKIVNAREDFFKDCKSAPPGALLGVPFLALEGLAVEVDAEAIVSESISSKFK